MSDDDKIAEVRKWFSTHKAIRTDYGDDLTLIEWGRVGSRTYGMRYLFDKKAACCTITGDLGEAIVQPCWETLTPASFVKSFYPGNMRYFVEKLKCSSDLYDWSAARFKEEFLQQCGKEYEDLADELYEVFDESASTKYQAFQVNNEQHNILREIDDCYEEWLYSLGRSYQIRLFAWVIGMHMAYEQLLKKDGE